MNGERLLCVIDSQPRRLIVVGDVHGCLDELLLLLDRIGPATDDLVISAGDMVRKGPHSARVLDFWRSRGYLAVQGNNERKVLGRPPLAWIVHPSEGDVLLRRDLLAYIASWPLVIDIPRLDVAIVHGGFLPGSRVDERTVLEQSDTLPRLRFVRRQDGAWRFVPKGEEGESDVLWSTVWNGDRFVVYGHTPLEQPRFDAKALGLDTGCVYGGSLSAAVFENGTWRTESVRAKRAYATR